MVSIACILRLDFLSMRTSDDALLNQISTNNSSFVSSVDYVLSQNNRSIRYLAHGNPKNPALICLHGSPGSLDMYADYYMDSVLLDHYYIISIDRPGFGYSGYGNAALTLSQQSEAVLAVIHKLKLDSVSLIGHSYGGPVAIKTAMINPEKIHSVHIVAGSLDPILEPREWWRPIASSPPLSWILSPPLRACNDEISALYKELLSLDQEWNKLISRLNIYHGKFDRLVPYANASYMQENATQAESIKLISFEAGDHFILWTQQDSIKQELLQNYEFLKDN